MFHKILILAASLGVVSAFINYFLFDVEINWWAVLVCALVIVHNLRELQYDKLKEHYDTTLVTLKSFRDAVFAECDKKTVDRIVLKQADNIVEMAPEEYRPELSKINDLLKKMHKLKHGDEHAHKTAHS